MKLNNIHGFHSIDAFVRYKIEKFQKGEKSFSALFEAMFDESDNVMVEYSDGYRVTKITYGEYKERILSVIPTVEDLLRDIPKGEIVGLYMQNSVEWLQVFWAILGAGYSPLLMNTRLSDEVLTGVLRDYSVKCVISDGRPFDVRTVSSKEVTVPAERAYVPASFGNEVIFMSSGTTNNVKLCAYSGENFFYQICDSAKIIQECPKIKQHYEGELKQLVLLPLCHVFGFIAVYLWFGFFAKTFVFPRDLNPDTIQKTVKKHKVTHIFAVPMVWEAVHKAAIRKIKERGEKTFKRFSRVRKLVNSLGALGDVLARKLLKEVREGLFGDSVCFLISGGSHIAEETISFFQGIGYHLVNGYGMTEIGITSVEKSGKKKIANRGSIGAPFGYTEYSISDEGVLLVRGKTRASRIMQNGASTPTDYDAWFSTGDIVRREGERYYFDGRVDDLIVLEDGENINPLLMELSLQVAGAERVCILRGQRGVVLLACVSGVFSEEKLNEIYEKLKKQAEEAKLSSVLKKILFTHEPLLGTGEFKLNRRKLSERLESGEIRTFDPRHIEEHIAELESGMEKEIASCFAEALGIEVGRISREDDFFTTLEGTSLDYFALLGLLKSRLGIDVMTSGDKKYTTVKAFVDFISTDN